MALPAGLSPTTATFEASRSDNLSYGSLLNVEFGMRSAKREDLSRACCPQDSALYTRHSSGAPGRTRTDEYEFTKLALLLLRHRGSAIYELRFTIYESLATSSTTATRKS